MNAKDVTQYCLDKPAAALEFPFGPDVSVFKVGGKMFALIAEINGYPSINLKCNPEEAVALRDIFKSVSPGYHMNKLHWNTVQIGGDVPSGELTRMIDNSYLLIIKSLPKHLRVKILPSF